MRIVMAVSLILAFGAGYAAGWWLGDRAGVPVIIPGVIAAGAAAWMVVRFWMWVDKHWDLI